MCPRNRFRMGQQWLWGSCKGSAGRIRFFDPRTNGKRLRAEQWEIYSFVAGQAKWKFRAKTIAFVPSCLS